MPKYATLLLLVMLVFVISGGFRQRYTVSFANGAELHVFATWMVTMGDAVWLFDDGGELVAKYPRYENITTQRCFRCREPIYNA